MYKKIKRRDAATGNWLIVEVPGTYVLQDGEELVSESGQPALPPPAVTPPTPQLSDSMSRADVEALLNRARSEERTRLNSQIEQERQERVSLQQRLDSFEQNNRQRELASLPADQRQAQELQDQLRRFEQQQAQSNQLVQALHAQMRATELFAYRERVLRAYGENIIPELVTGNSEQEIDASASRAAQIYQDYAARLSRQQSQPYTGQPPNTPNIPVVQPVMPGQQPFIPQALPVHPGYPVGFPSPVNSGQVQNPAQSVDIGQVTTEEAVRTGRWGGELRQSVLDNLRGGGGVSNIHLGHQPRWMDSMPMTTLPGGAQMPVAQPIPQAIPAHMHGVPTQQPQTPQQQPAPQPQYYQPQPAPQYQQPQAPQQVYYPQYQQQPAPDMNRQAALEAVQRTHAGGNPIVNGDPEARNALQAAQAFSPHSNPNQTYNARFANTPPLH